MARPQRSYTREFKVEAVKSVREKGDAVAEATRSLASGVMIISAQPPHRLSLEHQV